MQWRVIVLVPVGENALKQVPNLQPEVLFDPQVVALAQEMLEFSEDVLVFPRIELGFLFAIEILDLEEQVEETIIALYVIEVYCQEGLQSFVAVGELIHCAIMDRVALILVFLFQYLVVAGDYIARILLQQVKHTDVEVLVPLHCLRIVEH